jgi:hypothetical protein
MDAVSRESWVSRDTLRHPVLNLSVRRAVSHTPGIISFLVVTKSSRLPESF